VRVWRLCLLLDYLSLDEPAVVSTILPYVRPSAEIDSQLIVTKDQVAQMTPSPFLDLDQFPRLLPLKEAWIALRDEVRDLGDDRLPIDRDGKSHTEVWDEVASHMAANGTYGWMQGWGQPDVRRNWLQYGLVHQDRPVPFLGQSVPVARKLLAEIRGVEVAAFLRMAPQTFLPLHNHPELREKGLLQMHLTLDAAASCNYAYINVDGHFRQHRPGDAFVFDGSCDHFALNASTQMRTILYLEFAP
jgi:aspartyl/asparaginyl beta-hydroxylase (cupin superfamily)